MIADPLAALILLALALGSAAALVALVVAVAQDVTGH